MKSEKVIGLLFAFALLSACSSHTDSVAHKYPSRNVVQEREFNLQQAQQSALDKQEKQDRLDQLLWLKN